jgi:hypothetical protein
MMDNIAVFRKDHVPLLIVHGAGDQIISCGQAFRLFREACEPKELLILRAGHSSFGKTNEFVIKAREFLLGLEAPREVAAGSLG